MIYIEYSPFRTGRQIETSAGTMYELEEVATVDEIDKWLYANAKDWKWHIKTFPYTMDEYEVGIELHEDDVIAFKLRFGL